MTTATTDTPVSAPAPRADGTAWAILVMLSVSHLLNDTMQSLIAASYPILKQAFALDFGQIGLITLANQLTASLLQPIVGMWTDKHPQPFSLVFGMGATLCRSEEHTSELQSH